MTFNSGTATDYLDLLDDLVAVVTSRHLSTVAVNSGGTGHAVGDIIDITATGATSTHVARLEVTSVAAGVIDGIRVYRGGAYTVDPTTTTGNAQSATTGSGTGATFDLTFAATGWSRLARSQVAASATVDAGGSGYAVNDTLTVVGGVVAVGGSAATFNVDSVSSGAVTAVSLVSAGEYEVPPSNAALTTNDGSGNNACTLNVSYSDVTGDRIVVLEGEAGGSATDPLVGIKTYSDQTDETGLNTVYNWALFGMTTWSSSLNLHDQANISPGFSNLGNGELTTLDGDGAFVPLRDSGAFNIDYWIAATGRRVVLIARIEAAATVYYAHASFGLLNQFGTTTEVPFPAYVAGSSDRKRVWFRDTSSVFGGLSECVSLSNGPCFAWAPEGEWVSIKSGVISSVQDTSVSYGSSVSNSAPRAGQWPLFAPAAYSDSDDQIWGPAGAGSFDQEDITATTGATAIYRTPNTGDDLFPLFRVTLMQHDSAGDNYRIFGEIDGVFWFHVADAAISSEDRFAQDPRYYRIFQNGTQIEPWSYLALAED